MKKKLIIGIIIVIVLILLIPIPKHLNNGGSIEFKSVFYTVTKYRQLSLNNEKEFLEGFKVEILGFEIYNNKEKDLEKIDNSQKDIDNMLLDVINNKIRFIDEKNQECFFKDYRITENEFAKADRYTFVDFDQNGYNELVVCTTSKYGYNMIFNYDVLDKVIYGYVLGIRSLQNIKADGTYSASGGAGLNYYMQMSFNKNILIKNTLAVIDELSEINQIDGKNVSRNEVLEYIENWNKKVNCSWIEVENNVEEQEENISENEENSILPNVNKSYVGVWRDGDEQLSLYNEIIIYENNCVEYITYNGCIDFVTGNVDCDKAGSVYEMLLGSFNDNKIILNKKKNIVTNETKEISSIEYQLNDYGDKVIVLGKDKKVFIKKSDTPIKLTTNIELVNEIKNSNEIMQQNEKFNDALVEYIISSIKVYAQNGYILKSTKGDVSADKLTVLEIENNIYKYRNSITQLLKDKSIFKDKFIRNNKICCTYNLGRLLKEIGISSHMYIGIGCFDANYNKIYEYGKTEVEDYGTNNINIIRYLGFDSNNLVNKILFEIERLVKNNYILKDTKGNITAGKLSLEELKNNSDNYKRIINEFLTTTNSTINAIDIIYISFENNKLICECYFENLLNELGMSSHMGIGTNIDDNGIQIFVLE